MTVLVVSPHLDDAVLSAWLVLARGSVTVVTCFAGADAGEGSIDRGRRDEDVAALERIAATPVHLDHDDGPVRRLPEAQTLARLAEDLRPHVAAADEVWLPCGVGRHPDHVLARRAATLALRAHPGRPSVRLYADLPYAARRGWPGWLEAGRGSPVGGLLGQAARVRPRSPEVAWWRAVTRSGPGWPRLRWRAAALPAAARQAKLEAIRTYASQASQLGFGDDDPRTALLLAREAWWERR